MMMHKLSVLSALVLALSLLQATATVHALPTRGSYGQLARRAAASKVAKRQGPSLNPNQAKQKRQSSNDGPSQKLKRAVAAKATPAGYYAKRDGTVEQYLAKISKRASDAAHEAHIRMRSNGTESNPPVAPLVRNPKVDAAGPASKSGSVGGDFYAWASAAGIPVPTATAATAVSSPFVPAGNVTLPSASSGSNLQRRVAPHPGEPLSNTAKINVIGATGTGLGFTLINATATASSTSESSSSTKLAVTTNKVNIINDTTSTERDLPTVTKTLTFTVSPTVVETATVTLVPTVLPGAAEGKESYVPLVNSTATGKTNVNVNVTVSVDHETGSSSSASTGGNATKAKRQVVAFFEAPKKKYTREEMLSDEWEDCIVGVDAGCIEVPEQDEAGSTAGSFAKRASFSRVEMMGEEWEDCIIGVDEGCLEIPDN